MNSNTIEHVHISTITAGDTIMYKGEMKTVCKNNIKYDPFMGITIFGDNFKCGHTKVEKVIFWAETQRNKNLKN